MSEPLKPDPPMRYPYQQPTARCADFNAVVALYEKPAFKRELYGEETHGRFRYANTSKLLGNPLLEQNDSVRAALINRPEYADLKNRPGWNINFAVRDLQNRAFDEVTDDGSLEIYEQLHADHDKTQRRLADLNGAPQSLADIHRYLLPGVTVPRSLVEADTRAAARQRARPTTSRSHPTTRSPPTASTAELTGHDCQKLHTVALTGLAVDQSHLLRVERARRPQPFSCSL